MASTKETISGVPQPVGTERGIFNSGGRHLAAMTDDANACVGKVGSHSAVPALDSEILSAVRACNGYPKRGKDKTQNLLAKRIAKRWLDLLPSTREKLEALQKCGEEDLQERVVQKLLEELRNFGRKPVEYKNTATPAQEHERVLANRFSAAKYRGKLTSSQIKELEAIWASNSGDKHPVVTKSVAQGSSEGGRGIKRQCEEGHAEPNSGGQHSAVTKRMAHASSGDRPQAKRPSQEEHAHMPPRKRMPGVPLRGCSATASCSSTVAQQLPESAAIEGPRHAPANCVGGLNPKIYCLAVLVYTMLLTQRTLTSSIAKNFWRHSKNTWKL